MSAESLHKKLLVVANLAHATGDDIKSTYTPRLLLTMLMFFYNNSHFQDVPLPRLHSKSRISLAGVNYRKRAVR